MHRITLPLSSKCSQHWPSNCVDFELNKCDFLVGPFHFLCVFFFFLGFLDTTYFIIQSACRQFDLLRQKRKRDWCENISKTLKWNLIRWIITKIEEKKKWTYRIVITTLNDEWCDRSKRKYVRSEFIHVENKGCQMKGKRNHSKTTESRRRKIGERKRENGPEGKRIPFLFDFEMSTT